MDTLFGVLQSAAVLIAGLSIRLGVLLIVLAVLSVPVFLFLTGLKGVDALRRRLDGVMRAGGLFWRKNVYYAPGHTWLRQTGARRLTVGVDDLVQRLFQGPIGVNLPAPGTSVRAGEPLAKSGCPAGAPRSCRPSAAWSRASTKRFANPSLLHRDPYSRGWLFSVTPSDSECRSCRTARWREHGCATRARLSRFFDAQLHVAAADGGEFVTPPSALLSDHQWRESDAWFSRESLGTAAPNVAVKCRARLRRRHDAIGTEAGAMCRHVDDRLGHVIDVRLRIDASWDGQPDQVHAPGDSVPSDCIPNITVPISTPQCRPPRTLIDQ